VNRAHPNSPSNPQPICRILDSVYKNVPFRARTLSNSEVRNGSLSKGYHSFLKLKPFDQRSSSGQPGRVLSATFGLPTATFLARECFDILGNHLVCVVKSSSWQPSKMMRSRPSAPLCRRYLSYSPIHVHNNPAVDGSWLIQQKATENRRLFDPHSYHVM
jgi:hypothetical protein